MAKKKYLDIDVYTAGQQRMSRIFDLYDSVTVMFSGGKDSTAVLLLAVEEARKRDRLPLKVRFNDEEVLHPTTIDYVERVRQMPEVDLEWYCLPFEHRNACSVRQPFWFCWDDDDRDVWVRDLPEGAIHEHPLFVKGMNIHQFADALQAQDRSTGKTCIDLLGIRTEESLRRFQAAALKSEDNYLFTNVSTPCEPANTTYRGLAKGWPIFDWSSTDVWKLVAIKEADYNRTYDLFNRTRLYNRHLTQRVCQPFGEEPLRGLWVYAECWPELWDKMQRRVQGVNAAMRYSNERIWQGQDKPDDMSWRDFVQMALTWMNPEDQKILKKQMNQVVRRHYNRTDEAIPDADDHPLTGTSWKFISMMVMRGDRKGRRRGMLGNRAKSALKKAGMTFEEAQQKFGKGQT